MQTILTGTDSQKFEDWHRRKALLHNYSTRWQYTLFISSNRTQEILLNNTLRHRGYENKPTKKSYLPKYFDI